MFPLTVEAPWTPNKKTETWTFTSLSSDGHIRWFDTNYTTARTHLTGGITGTPQFVVGQTWGASKYWVYRGFLFFDTSHIPDSANVTSATLSVCISWDGSDTEFNVTVQNGQPTYPHNPLEMGDYYYLQYSGDGGKRQTDDGLSVGSYWNITLNEDGRSWINAEGTTKLCLRSNREINAVTPTGDETVTIYSLESGESSASILYATYEWEEEEDPPASGGDTGDGEQTTIPEITVPKFHIPIWGYYLILGSIGIVAFASILTKPKHRRGSPRGIKVKKNQKRYPKRNKKGKFTK